jgi:hypothetical protein
LANWSIKKFHESVYIHSLLYIIDLKLINILCYGATS